jgi:glucose/arabinose dehydrogenase
MRSILSLLLATAALPALAAAPCTRGTLIHQKAVLSDWSDDAPGQCRRILLPDLPPPYATPQATNPPNEIARPAGLLPSVPKGFTVALAYQDKKRPELIRLAPNGDLFVVEPVAHQIRVLRPDGRGGFAADSVFTTGLDGPYGISFWPPGPSPQYLYVADATQVIRFPYAVGDLVARGPSSLIVDGLPTGGHGQHDVVFSPDGGTMFVSIGSLSDDDDEGEDESGRALIMRYAPDGTGAAVFATGLRNPKALGIEPASGLLWTSVNERNELGDNLVPDFVTAVTDGQYYGWPIFYLSNANIDPTHAGQAPDPPPPVATPDLLHQAHAASLGFGFSGNAFPKAWRGAYVALHGSVSRADRLGSKLVLVAVQANGHAGNRTTDFMTGFTIADPATPDGTATWGRPVAAVFAPDGSMYVTDDLSDAIFRVTKN